MLYQSYATTQQVPSLTPVHVRPSSGLTKKSQRNQNFVQVSSFSVNKKVFSYWEELQQTSETKITHCLNKKKKEKQNKENAEKTTEVVAENGGKKKTKKNFWTQLAPKAKK